MSRFRSFVIRFGAPLVLIAGVGGVLAARRAVALRHTIELWADSLHWGAGPLAIGLPFVPAYLEGRRIGSLDSVRLERHEPRMVDSLRLVIDLSVSARQRAELANCAFQLATFEPEEFKHALQCASDTTDLVRFGSVEFVQSGSVPLYVSATDLSCAPWTDRADRADRACISARVRAQVQRRVRRAVRVRVR